MPIFHITIGRRGAPRLSFEVSAADAFRAHEQHVELAQVGERVDVKAVPVDQPVEEQVQAFRLAGAL